MLSRSARALRWRDSHARVHAFRLPALAALVCALGFAAACGDGDDGGSRGGDGGDGAGGDDSGAVGGDGSGAVGGGGVGVPMTVPLDQLPREIARVYCDVIERCFGTLAEILPQPECVPNFETQFRNGDFAAIEAAIEAGSVEYDPSAAPACLRALSDADCELLAERNPDACEKALRGSVPLGSGCSVDAECAGPAFCDVADTCPGVCAAPRAEGETCDDDSACESGLNWGNGTCEDRASAGEACGGPSGPDCHVGLLCTGETEDASGTCASTDTVTSRAEGEACDITTLSLCEPGLSCVFDGLDVVTPTYECRQKSASGGECMLGFPEPCPEGEYCDDPIPIDGIAGACTTLPSAGEACLSGDRALRCAIGLVCSENRCSTRKANGGSCDAGGECYSERCVDGTCQGTEFCTGD